ncbi:hypothetical protein ccbrp13_24720 [Ktedonobacteria bacterium brp13]|nr:hypothetical protein ccbrp13_24720 [Ktedonobacteria bacterium brp13]
MAFCGNCGLLLNADTIRCSRCGAETGFDPIMPVVHTHTDDATIISQNSQPQPNNDPTILSSSLGMSYPVYPVTSDNNSPTTHSTPQDNPIQRSTPPLGGLVLPAANTYTTPALPAANTYMIPSPVNMQPAFPAAGSQFPMPPVRPRKIQKWLIISTALLVLVLIVGVVGVVTFSTAPSTGNNTTATTAGSSTTQAAPASPVTQAAPASPVTQAAPQPTPTPTPVPPLFSGQRTAYDASTNSYTANYIEGFTGNNIRIEADITSQGNGGGIIFRSPNGVGTGYRLRIGTDGSYDLASPTAALVSNTKSASIKTGQNVSNHVTIVAIGSQITIWINGQLLNQLTDSSYSTGGVAVMTVDFGAIGTTICAMTIYQA